MKLETIILLLEAAREIDSMNEDEAFTDAIDNIVDAIVNEIGDDITSKNDEALTQCAYGDVSISTTIKKLKLHGVVL